MKLLKVTTRFLLTILVCIGAAVLACTAQQPKPTIPTPPPTGKVPAKVKVKDKTTKPPKVMGLPQIEIGDGVTSERSITVDPKVSLTLCITEGTVSVNGWSRNEVRVFVKDGSRVDFKALQKSRDGNPVWISLVGVKKAPGGATVNPECIAGDEIELDVPENTSLTMKGGDTTTLIDTVRRVSVTTAGGSVSVRNVSQGVRATTYQGDVVVSNSNGPMGLETTSGNIVAGGISPSEVGDAFRARTNSGAISLQKMDFRFAEVNSITGSVLFAGELPSGGSFSFATTNGALRLVLPDKTSCRVAVTYAFGNFRSDLPLKVETESVSAGSVKRVVGTIGTPEGGDCSLRLSTNTGAVSIRKLQH
ncbi:MAG TPA: DUF4097 family beta strand repeat-containing protein [Pyrinomonadaceae bacterium]